MEKIKVFLISGAIGIFAIATTVFLSAASQKDEIVIPPVKRAVWQGYIMRIEGNAVNIYSVTNEGETYSRSVENVNIYDLPETVRGDLKNGIVAQTENELAALIENFSS